MKRGRPKHNDILTPREWEVAPLLREGLTNQQIAERLGISLAGAKYHVAEIMAKLQVSSRKEAVDRIGREKRRGILFPFRLFKLSPLHLTLAAAVIVIAIAGYAGGRDLVAGSDEPPALARDSSSGADIDPEVELALRARETAPFRNTVLLTKAELQPDAAALLRGVAQVSTMPGLEAYLSVVPETRLIVVDRSAELEPGVGDFVAKQLVAGRALIQINACLEEPAFQSSYPPRPFTGGTVTEIDADGTTRVFAQLPEPANPMLQTCSSLRDAALPFFSYRRMLTEEQPALPPAGRQGWYSEGINRFSEEVPESLDTAIRLFDSGEVGSVIPLPCPRAAGVGTPVPMEPDC